MQVLTAESAVPDGLCETHRPIRVLVVDDSIVTRAVIARTIAAEPDMEVVAQAGNGRAALDALGTCRADVIILDLEMPGGGGLDVLPALIAAGGNARVLIVSSSAVAGADATVTALRLGAAGTLLKPAVGFGEAFPAMLLDRVRRLSGTPSSASAAPATRRRPPEPRASAESGIDCVAIGASTGGVHALAAFFGSYPADLAAPILVTQHLPTTFMRHFARQLGEMAGRPVAIAADGMAVERGAILLAPGDASLTLLRTRGAVHVKLVRERAAPGSLILADQMLDAAARIYGAAAIGVVLSGMGRDGLAGARTLREAGGVVLAQDAASSVVWGMPGVIVQAGLADAVMPPAMLAERIAQIAATRAEQRRWK